MYLFDDFIFPFRDTFIDEGKRPKIPIGSRIYDFFWRYEDENMQVYQSPFIAFSSSIKVVDSFTDYSFLIIFASFYLMLIMNVTSLLF